MRLLKILRNTLRLKKSEKPSLIRYYILRSKFGFGIKIHHFQQSDTVFHNHPWAGISFIFGRYKEQFEDKQEIIHVRRLFNIISPYRRHKVIIYKPIWTLFIHGFRVNECWSWGDRTKPWRGPDS